MPLFSKDLITFMISFASLFVSAIVEAITDENPLLSFLLIVLSPEFKRTFSKSVADLGISVACFIILPHPPDIVFCESKKMAFQTAQ